MHTEKEVTHSNLMYDSVSKIDVMYIQYLYRCFCTSLPVQPSDVADGWRDERGRRWMSVTEGRNVLTGPGILRL